MKQPFPSENKVFFQNNRTNVFPIGNVWSTFNSDVQSNVGVFRVSQRLTINTSSADQANLGIPVAFRSFDGRVWALCATRFFSNSGTPTASFSEDASSGFSTNYSADVSDAEVFNGSLCATTSTRLLSKVANGAGTGAWTEQDNLSTGTNHTIVYFKRFDRLYYSDLGSIMRSISTSWVTADPGFDYAINLAPFSSIEYTITCAKSTSSSIWIGTLNKLSNGMPGKVCQWDGISAQTSNEFEMNNAVGAMAIVIDPIFDSPWVMDSNGVLSSFNGSGFVEEGRLPFPFSLLPYNVTDNDNERFIHPNGMYFTKNGTLRCLINNRTNQGNVVESMPSGIWEWSRESGFQHVQSSTYTVSGVGAVTDFGQNMVTRVGALQSMNLIGSLNGTIMAGVQYFTNAVSSASAIFIENSTLNADSTIQKKGYFVTAFFDSSELASSWDKYWTTFSPLASTDLLSFKYRVTEENAVVGDITWVNTTSFTVLNSAVDISLYWTSGTGGEVEILRGTGGGSCAHITNAVNSAGTWTVTLDEVITGVTTGTATARFQKWTKIFPAEVLSTGMTYNQWAMDSNSAPRIQIKGCFTRTGNGEFYRSVITSKGDIKIN